MATVPEFISVLRKIRDEIYPEVNQTYNDALVLKEAIDIGKVDFDEKINQFNIDYSEFETSKSEVDAGVTAAQQSALSASQSANTATQKANEIKGITAQSITGAPGTLASASYNPVDGKFTFTIPQGTKGDKGESFTVNSSGDTAGRALYDNAIMGWSYLDVTTSLLYFKKSNATADWSDGVPFGKGDTGEDGEAGVGIVSFTFVETTDLSGQPAQPGATDTYRVTLSNALTFDYNVYNGVDADISQFITISTAQTITGPKEFTQSPKVPDGVESTDVVNKGQLDLKETTQAFARSGLAEGNIELVSNQIQLSNGKFIISNGFNSNTVVNEGTKTLTISDLQDGINFVKFNGTTYSATQNEPAFGTTSTTSDYYLDGKWYNSSDVAYNPQIAYLNKGSKLLEVQQVSGQLVDLHLDKFYPEIVINSLVVTGNRKFIDLETIFNNNRYVVDNPFGNDKYMDCDVRAEIFYNGVWSEVNQGSIWSTAVETYGVKGYSNLEGLVVQTGYSALLSESGSHYGTFGHGGGTTPKLTSAPARIIVTYVGVTK